MIRRLRRTNIPHPRAISLLSIFPCERSGALLIQGHQSLGECDCVVACEVIRINQLGAIDSWIAPFPFIHTHPLDLAFKFHHNTNYRQ